MDIFKKELLIFFVVLFMLPVPVFPQSDVERATSGEIPGRLVPETSPPLDTREEERQEQPSRRENITAGSRFRVTSIVLNGANSLPADTFTPLISKYENTELSFADLNTLAKEIESACFDHGILAAVFVPPQDVTGGTVTLKVIEAAMGEVEILPHKYFNPERLAYYWRIPRGEVINYSEISRSLQAMNKNPDREVKASLHAGQAPGTTDVALSAKTSFPLHLGASYDNEGGVSTGRERWSLGARYNNLLGFDDSLYTGYSWGKEFNGEYAYHLVPLNNDGASVLYGASVSRATPAKGFESYGIVSTSINYSVSLRQDLYSGNDYLGEAYAAFDAKDKTVVMNTGTYSRDRLRIARTGGKLYSNDFGGASSGWTEFSQGLPWFGASDEDDPLVSRGNPVFTKLTAGLQHKINLPLKLQASFKLESQLSSTQLASSETYALGGIDSVRGYPSSDYLADNALQVNNELLIPVVFIPPSWKLPYARQSLRDQTKLVTFFDYGLGYRRQDEAKRANLAGIGAGLRLRLYDQGQMRLEWGFPVGDDTRAESGHSRFHFSIELQEKLPEEIERMKKQWEDEHLRLWAWRLVDKGTESFDARLRENISTLLNEARSCYERGKLKEARQYYAQVVVVVTSVYKQALEYLQDSMENNRRLKAMNQKAGELHAAGQLAQAKELWEQVAKQRMGTLLLSY